MLKKIIFIEELVYNIVIIYLRLYTYYYIIIVGVSTSDFVIIQKASWPIL
jgi:hypothetical protein